MTARRSCSVFAMAAAGLLWGSGSLTANAQAQSQPPAMSADRDRALADIPSGKAIVTFNNGMLTVKARGARLSDVLRTACGLIGADFSALADFDQQVSRIIGPAPAADVLKGLLRNAGLNYAMSGSASDSNLPTSLMILSGGHEPPASPVATEPRMAAAAAPELPNLTAANTQAVEDNSADREIADKPSKAQLALLDKLREGLAGADADATTVPVQRDSGVRSGRRRR